jgi:hypothetical protein
MGDTNNHRGGSPAVSSIATKRFVMEDCEKKTVRLRNETAPTVLAAIEKHFWNWLDLSCAAFRATVFVTGNARAS